MNYNPVGLAAGVAKINTGKMMADQADQAGVLSDESAEAVEADQVGRKETQGQVEVDQSPQPAIDESPRMIEITLREGDGLVTTLFAVEPDFMAIATDRAMSASMAIEGQPSSELAAIRLGQILHRFGIVIGWDRADSLGNLLPFTAETFQNWLSRNPQRFDTTFKIASQVFGH